MPTVIQPGALVSYNLVPSNNSPFSSVPTDVQTEEDPSTRFTTVRSLFHQIKKTLGDTLFVTNVSPTNFVAIERGREARRCHWRLRRYDSKSALLIISIPTKVHEQLHLDLATRILFQIQNIGLQESWRPLGSAIFRIQGHPGGDGGEGDYTGGPLPQMRNNISWPTLVIEAGDSESLNGLRNDMRWWFGASSHAVKIVILAKFDRRSQNIILERWEEEAQGRAGATSTRASGQAILEPGLQQAITITREDGVNHTIYRVTSGALLLKFQLLFLRDARPGEHDIVIDIPALERYAEAVWDYA